MIFVPFVFVVATDIYETERLSVAIIVSLSFDECTSKRKNFVATEKFPFEKKRNKVLKRNSYNRINIIISRNIFNFLG